MACETITKVQFSICVEKLHMTYEKLYTEVAFLSCAVIQSCYQLQSHNLKLEESACAIPHKTASPDISYTKAAFQHGVMYVCENMWKVMMSDIILPCSISES